MPGEWREMPPDARRPSIDAIAPAYPAPMPAHTNPAAAPPASDGMTAPDLARLPHQELADVLVPALVTRLADGRTVEPVWRNEIGGVTFRLGSGTSVDYVKVGPPHPEHSPASDAERLAWVGTYVVAPVPLGWGIDDGLAWLLTRGIPGDSAVSPARRAQPELAVPALGRALRAFHDQVPVDACPWTWSLEDRLVTDVIVPLDGPGTVTQTPTCAQPTDGVARAARIALLAEAPPLDLVVCHGDACNPNFLLDADASPVGYVDLGSLGVADRWADLAPACLSLVWNYGPGLTDSLLDAYGIVRDDVLLDYYTRVWNAS